MATLKDLHIGEEINRRIDALGLTYAEVARRLNVDRTTMYSIVKSKTIDTERLVKLCNILECNFFDLYIPFVAYRVVEVRDVADLVDMLGDGKSLIITLTVKNR